MRPSILLTALAGLVALAAPAAAQAAAPPIPTVSISYADLRLSTPADAGTMLRRIRRAAVDVCRRDPLMVGSDIATIERFEICRRQVISQAVTRLNAPLVTAAAESHATLERVALTPSDR